MIHQRSIHPWPLLCRCQEVGCQALPRRLQVAVAQGTVQATVLRGRGWGTPCHHWDHGGTLQTANLWLKITFVAQVYSATFSKITWILVRNMHFGYWNVFWRITSCFYWLKPGVQTRIRMITNMFMAKITFVALPTNDVYLDDIYLDWCAINLFIYIYTSIYIYILYIYKHANTVKHVCTHVWAFQSNTIFPEN